MDLSICANNNNNNNHKWPSLLHYGQSQSEIMFTVELKAYISDVNIAVIMAQQN